MTNELDFQRKTERGLVNEEKNIEERRGIITGKEIPHVHEDLNNPKNVPCDWICYLHILEILCDITNLFNHQNNHHLKKHSASRSKFLLCTKYCEAFFHWNLSKTVEFKIVYLIGSQLEIRVVDKYGSFRWQNAYLHIKTTICIDIN